MSKMIGEDEPTITWDPGGFLYTPNSCSLLGNITMLQSVRW